MAKEKTQNPKELIACGSDQASKKLSKVDSKPYLITSLELNIEAKAQLADACVDQQHSQQMSRVVTNLPMDEIAFLELIPVNGYFH